ncbi:response regulator, partial [Pseudomonas chlororaphis]|uniref:response regulator n=1 Tax=Pseudomonas chlororaphis TaxID=587753 RepID=UPI001B33378F
TLRRRRWPPCCVALSVSDNGIGIAPAMQEKIFERFTQASEEVAQRYGGTGLGLAISKHLVELLGGRIGVDSEVGRGRRDFVAARGGLLESDGHRVWLAEEGAEALTLCQQRRFDLILLDVHLPGISGVELCKRIRGTPGANRDCRIFALTASVQPALVRSYLEAGMQGILAKPLKLHSLRQALAGQAPLAAAAQADEELDGALLETHRTLLGTEKLKGLLTVLRDSLAQHRVTLTDAIAADDCTEIAHLAHRLAGSSDSLGLSALARVMRALEAAALGNDQQAVQRLAPQVSEQLQRSMQTLDALLET